MLLLLAVGVVAWAFNAMAVRARNEGAVKPAATSSAPRPRRFLRVSAICVFPLRQLVGWQRHRQVEHAAYTLLVGWILTLEEAGKRLPGLGCHVTVHQ